MAKALLAMKSQRSFAIYCVIRFNRTNEDAQYFLNKFYEENALEEANQLQDAVYKQYLFCFTTK
jgi:hypothetical protein